MTAGNVSGTRQEISGELRAALRWNLMETREHRGKAGETSGRDGGTSVELLDASAKNIVSGARDGEGRGRIGGYRLAGKFARGDAKRIRDFLQSCGPGPPSPAENTKDGLLVQVRIESELFDAHASVDSEPVHSLRHQFAAGLIGAR